MMMMIFILGVAVCLSACSWGGKGRSRSGDDDAVQKPALAAYQQITPEQAKEKMAQEDTYILLDVRTEEEFAQERIEGAVLIPDSEIKDQAEVQLTDKDAIILVYCRSGRRSELAAKELIRMGYTKVYDFGGIIDWPYDTVRD